AIIVGVSPALTIYIRVAGDGTLAGRLAPAALDSTAPAEKPEPEFCVARARTAASRESRLDCAGPAVFDDPCDRLAESFHFSFSSSRALWPEGRQPLSSSAPSKNAAPK